MIAPFWADVDTRGGGVGGHVWMKVVGSTLAVTWDNVGYYDQNSDKLNSFQVLISDGLDASMELGNNICFCYESMEWTTGQQSGINGFGGIAATAGVNNGDGTNYFQIGRFNEVGYAYDGPHGSNDGIDYLDDKSFCFNAVGVNIPPIPANFPLGNTVTLDTCQTLDLTVTFLSPEVDQTTSVVVTGTLPVDMVITNTPDNTATARIQWTPSIDETVTLTIVATDNAADPGGSTKTITIVAQNCIAPSTQTPLTPAPSPLPSAQPSAVPSTSPSRAPSSQPSGSPSFESLSHSLCENFAVHARNTVTFNGVVTTIHGGDVGVSPGTSITGAYQFEDGEVVDDSVDFASSVLAAHAAAMTVRDDGKAMEIEIGGITFTPGTYRSDRAINFAYGTVVTLDGLNEPNPVFHFQAKSTLVTGANTHFILKNGAKAENVLWALGTAATLGASSVLQGSILAGTAITFGTKSVLHGCALAQSAVTFESQGSIDLTHYVDATGNAETGLTRYLRG